LLGRVGLNVESDGDLYDGRLFHVAKREGRPLHGRERGHRLLADAFGLAVEEGLLGRSFIVRDLYVAIGEGVGDAGRVVREIALAAFDEIEGGIHSDARDPCGECGVHAEAGELVVGAEEGLLRGLFCVFLIARDAKGDAMNLNEVAIHQNAVSVPVAGQNLPNRFFLFLIHAAIRQWFAVPVRNVCKEIFWRGIAEGFMGLLAFLRPLFLRKIVMNGRCAGWITVACLAIACGRGFAQVAEPSCTPGSIGGGGGYGVEAKGPPLLAVMKTTFDQNLTGGNSIHTESHVFMARDAAGRLMTQAMQVCVPVENGQSLPRYMVNVHDAGNASWTTWSMGDASEEVAYVSHPQAASAQTKRPMSRAVMPARSEYKRDYLGYKTIGGVSAQGFRDTRTIPAGEEGNAQELVTVTENWKSTDLKMVVMEVQDDPRHGRMVTAVESITMGEPDPAVFSPPKGYVLKERTQ